MSPIETLDRWYRDIEPKPTGTDRSVVFRYAGVWLVWSSLVGFVAGTVDVAAGPGVVLGVLLFITLSAFHSWWWSCADTDRATARGATITLALGVSALVIAVIARFLGGSVKIWFWLIPPVVMVAIACWRSSDPSARWHSPSLRWVDRAVASGLWGGMLLAAALVLHALAPTWVRGHVAFEPVSRGGYDDSFSGFRETTPRARAGSPRLLPIVLSGEWVPGEKFFPPPRCPGDCGQVVEDFLKDDGEARLRVSDDGLTGSDPIPWTYGAVELLYDSRSRALRVFNGTHTARFAQGIKVAQWRTLVAAPCSNALWLVLVSAAGVLAAGVVWRCTRRAVAPFEDRAAWHDGTLAPDGTLTPEDGGATAQAPERLRGKSGSVVFLRIAGATQTTGVPYRVPAPGESAEVFLGARASLDAKVKHVREAWAVWALVVVTASVAPLVVAVVTAPFWPWTTP